MDRKSTILVVDDEPRYLRLVELNLTSNGYLVQTASDGKQSIEMVATGEPDLVLLDVMMPVMDGFEACERIRDFSDIPIIMVTAKTEEADRVRGLDIGADDYILKPFSSQELLARVRAVLRRAKREGPFGFENVVLRHHELEIDIPKAEVRVNGQSVRLTATEYRLLVTLAESKGKLVTSEELLTKVWGVEYRDEKDVLWVGLSRLRQKIEPDPKNPIHIITRQGMGYIFPLEEDV
ncbi:MAG TPA: response regulator transcription factor [Anaerolineae bacterium]|nr:response regulator transcription factor [Anaerolineae bacterium]